MSIHLDTMKRLLTNSLPCLLALLAVQACGGGSGGGAPATSNAATELSGPLRGVLMIEERANKRVMDAWFTRAGSAQLAPQVLWENAGQSCAVQGSVAEVSPAEQAGTHWRQSQFAGESITIAARSGARLTLLPQRYGDAVMYATSERWLPVSLPDDATLSVSGAEGVPAFNAVPLAPMVRLEQLAPESGVSFDPGAPVRWVPADNAGDRIELQVSAVTNEQSSPAISIRCVLDDAAGQFELPEAVISRLPQGALLSYQLARVRTHTRLAGESSLEIVQVSYP